MSKRFETDQRIFAKDHGEITLYKRADHKVPKWQVRVKVSGSKGYVRRSCGTKDEFEARRFAERLYDSLVAKFKSTGSTQTKTFSDVVGEWLIDLEKRGIKKGLIDEFASRLENYACRYWGATYIDQIGVQELAGFIDWRKSNGIRSTPTDATIRKDLVPVGLVFKYAYGQKYMSQLLRVNGDFSSGERRPHFEDDEWQTLLNKLDDWVEQKRGDKRAYRDRFYLRSYILILGNSGIRPGVEHQSITWTAVRFEQFPGVYRKVLVLLVKKSKVGRARKVIPNPVVSQYIGELKDFRDSEVKRLGREFNEDESIFCHENGKPILSFRKGFKAYLEHIGLHRNLQGEARVPYSLRHTYATQRIDQGVNHWDLAKNMGTSVEELEKHYVHADHKRYGLEFLAAKPLVPSDTDTLERFMK